MCQYAYGAIGTAGIPTMFAHTFDRIGIWNETENDTEK